MTMKNCELCKGLARMHCESDGASLCWRCDYKVHSANFLVARHSRTLLCNVCQSPTPWTAVGVKLGPTVSVCNSCVQNYDNIIADEESEATNRDADVQPDMESDNFDYNEEEDDEEDVYDDEEDTDFEDNQVVPWSPSTPPPPSAANSPSHSDEESYSSSSISSQRDQRESQRKRTRQNADRRNNVNCISTSSQGNADKRPATVAAPAADGYGGGEGRVGLVDSLSTKTEKNLKKRRIGTGGPGVARSRSGSIVESVKKVHMQEERSTAAIAELCRLSEHPSTVDCYFSKSS